MQISEFPTGDKTRLIEFGRFAAQNHEKRGLSKPETFKFLGFVLICGKSRRGDFQIWRKSRRDRMRVKLRVDEPTNEIESLRKIDEDRGLAWRAVFSERTGRVAGKAQPVVK